MRPQRLRQQPNFNPAAYLPSVLASFWIGQGCTDVQRKENPCSEFLQRVRKEEISAASRIRAPDGSRSSTSTAKTRVRSPARAARRAQRVKRILGERKS